MTHYLYKPHVHGPEHVTTPDILIDRVYRNLNTQYGVDLLSAPVNHLSSNTEIQCVSPAVTMTPAYMLIACGGGVLLSIGTELARDEQGDVAGSIFISRFAWRLKYVSDHLEKITLVARTGLSANNGSRKDVPLASYPLPDVLLKQFDDEATELPRGIMICVTATGIAQQVKVPNSVEIGLIDSVSGRELSHRISLLDVNQDRWKKRPPSRYTVGPTSGDIQHYI